VSDATRRQVPKLNEEQFASWHHQFGSDLRVFLCGVLKDPEAAEEALQRTWVKLWEGGAAVEPEKIRSWLFQVGFREALQLRRSQQLQTRKLSEWFSWKKTQGVFTSEGASEGLPRRISSNVEFVDLPAAEESLVRGEEYEALRKAIDDLSLEQKIVLQKRLEGEQTFQQIANELQVPLGTVLTRMRLALARLKKSLSESKSKESR
jgi:RNA polymerase sigma factor (sigma-70 family)